MVKSLISLLLFPSIVLVAQNTLIKVNDNGIDTQDFERKYQENLKFDGLQKTINTYVASMVLIDNAKNSKIDTTRTFKKACNAQISSVYKDYFPPKNITQPFYELYVKRLAKVRDIQLLDYPIKNFLQPSDTLVAYKKIQELKKDLQSKKITFETVVDKFSSDKNYLKPKTVAALQFDKNIEDKIYNTPIGGVAEIRLLDRYLLIKIVAERPARESYSINTIFINNQKPDAERVINEIYVKLKAKENLEDIAIKYQNSIEKQTPALIVTADNLTPQIIQKLKTMKAGDYTTPEKGKGFWQIIQLVEKYITINNNNVKPYIKTYFSPDELDGKFAEAVYTTYKDKVRVTTSNDNLAAIKNAYKNINDSLVFTHNKPVFTINTTNISQQNIVIQTNLWRKKVNETTTPENLIDFVGETLKKKVIYNEIKNNFELYDDNFNDFRNQIINSTLIEMYNQNILYSGLDKDKTKQEAYLTKNKENYKWSERVDVAFYYAQNKKTAEDILSLLQKGESVQSILNEYKGKLGTDKSLLLFSSEGIVNKDDKLFPKNATFEPSVKLYEDKGKYIVVVIKKNIPVQYMTLQEASPVLIPNYKQQLLDDLIKDLVIKANVIIDDTELQKLKGKYK